MKCKFCKTNMALFDIIKQDRDILYLYSCIECETIAIKHSRKVKSEWIKVTSVKAK